MVATLKLLSDVFKLRIGAAITLCAVAGMAVSPGTLPAPSQIAVLVLAVFLSSASAGAFNQYAERDLDARMQRTRNRPFVTGTFRAGWKWLGGIGLIFLLAVSSAALVLNLYVALYVFLGAFFYGVVYTVWLKRRSVWNIVIGGLAGSFAVLAGAAAVTPELAPNSVILAVVLFLWTPPHFWSLAMVLQRDYEAAAVPMLPVVVGDSIAARVILAHTVLLVLVSLTPLAFGMSWLYAAGALTGGGYFIARSLQLARRPGPQAAMVNFKASFVQLGLLLIAAVLEGAPSA